MENSINLNSFADILDVQHAIWFTKEALLDKGYTQGQTNEITEAFLNGLKWAQSDGRFLNGQRTSAPQTLE